MADDPDPDDPSPQLTALRPWPPATTKKRKRKTSATPWYYKDATKIKKLRQHVSKTPVKAAPASSTSAGSSKVTRTRQRRDTLALEITPATPTTKLHFSDLPPEVRNNIYDAALALSNNHPVRLTSGTSAMGHQLALGLLGTCRLIRKEALTSYLKHPNGFRIDIVKLSKNTRREGPLEYFTDCYDSRSKAYEKPLKDFMSSVKITHELNKSAGLKSIDSLTFSYFHKYPAGYKNGDVLPEVADVTIIWQFLKEKPFFRLEVVDNLTAETDQSKITLALAEVDGTVRNMMENRSVREFAVEDVWVVCDKVYYSCLNKRVGDGVRR